MPLTDCQGIGGSGWFRIYWQELGSGVHVLKFFNYLNIEQPANKITIYNITSETDLVKSNPPQLTENTAVVHIKDLTSNCLDSQWVEIDTIKDGQVARSIRSKFYWPSNSEDIALTLAFESSGYDDIDNYFDMSIGDDINFIGTTSISDMNYDWNLTGLTPNSLDGCNDQNHCVLDSDDVIGGFYNLSLEAYNDAISLYSEKEFVVVSNDLDSSYGDGGLASLSSNNTINLDAGLSGSLVSFDGRYNCHLVLSNGSNISSKNDVEANSCFFDVYGSQIGDPNATYDVNILVTEIRTGRTINKSKSIEITDPADDSVVTILSPSLNSSYSCEENITFSLSTENILTINGNYWYLNQSLPNDITTLPNNYIISGNSQIVSTTELLADSDLSFEDNNVTVIVNYVDISSFIPNFAFNSVDFLMDNSNCNSSCINFTHHGNNLDVYIISSCADDFENYTFDFSSNIDKSIFSNKSFTSVSGLTWSPNNSRLRFRLNYLPLSIGVSHIFTFSYYDADGNLIALDSTDHSNLIPV